MKTSDKRIITTHVGSLPRMPELDALLIRRDHGKVVDPDEFAAAVDRSLDYVIQRQIESGIDVGSDGEQPTDAELKTWIAGFPIEPLPNSSNHHEDHR